MPSTTAPVAVTTLAMSRVEEVTEQGFNNKQITLEILVREYPIHMATRQGALVIQTISATFGLDAIDLGRPSHLSRPASTSIPTERKTPSNDSQCGNASRFKLYNERPIRILTSRYRRREQWMISPPRFMPASDLERWKDANSLIRMAPGLNL